MTERRAPRGTREPTPAMLALHERDVAHTPGLWQDGLATFRHALDALHDAADPAVPPNLLPHQAAQVALMREALRSLASAHDLAHRGRYLEVLDLVREPFESYIALVYLRHHPEEHARFTSIADAALPRDAAPAPTVEEMKQRILVRMLPAYGPAIARGWQTKADRWSAALAAPTRRTLPDDHARQPAPSPTDELASFDACAEQACGVLALLLTQTVLLRRSLGHRDLPEVQVFGWRYARWRKRVRRARPADTAER